MKKKKTTQACKETLSVASRAYDGDCPLKDITTRSGDTLALFIKREIEDVSGHEFDKYTALIEARVAVLKAIHELERVSDALNNAANKELERRNA